MVWRVEVAIVRTAMALSESEKSIKLKVEQGNKVPAVMNSFGGGVLGMNQSQQ